MKTYSVPVWRLIYNFVVLSLATAIWVHGMLYLKAIPEADYLYKMVLVVGLVFSGALLYELLTEPVKIYLRDDSSVELVGILKKTTIIPSDIECLLVSYGKRGRVGIKYAGGSVGFYKYMSGWSDLVRELGLVMQANKDKKASAHEPA